MRKLLAAILLAASLPAMAGDPWTDKQKALGAGFVVEAAYVHRNFQIGIGVGF